ncbi:3-keto-5-aminohexanoate cleavage protein [Trinickia terrae]|uniref:3-keto-5-aminohexanoate cleavage protein n=1 Tax=Trinickia terrae TaxID=2571161 RepID=A0A4V5PI84_9BURK|nr:3-keto-5-aminohexanoate cleavage protein [Trinickia terrae]TKC78940.1 3-keto-5-aminohexanoate cleavage protein [Trinickia terrae]
MTKALYITAAPVGAVPKFLDPLSPVFVPASLLDCLDEDLRAAILKTLREEGWEAADEGGIALQRGFAATPDDVAAIEPHGAPPVVPHELLWRIAPVGVARQVVLQLTTFGWLVDDNGNLSWPHARVNSYLPPELVQQIRNADATILDALVAAGWAYRGAGYWQPGKGRSPYLPITAEQIVDDARRSLVEGAAVVHFHTRANDDRGQLEIPGLGAPISTGAQRNQIVLDDYEHIVTSLRDLEPAAILNLSTSARGNKSASESPLRRAHLKHYGPALAHPDVASFSPGPVVFQSGGGYDNPHGFLVQQLEHFMKIGVRPEIEVFNHTIVENATSIYRDALQKSGVPVLFMLVAAVDQHRRDAVSGELDDDSLIDVASRKQIATLLQSGDAESAAAAVRIAADALRPTVEKLREHFPSSRISILLPGAFHAILVGLALALDLDGVRVGLEDALNVFDPRVPGGIRRACGTGDQVRALRLELECRGIAILDPEALRDELGMARAEIALFRKTTKALSPYVPLAANAQALPSAAPLVAALSSVLDAYRQLEDRFAAELLSAAASLPTDPAALAAAVRETARVLGVNIRFFIEEQDRYSDHEHLVFSDIYAPQALNFAREILAQRGHSTARYDDALACYARPGETVSRETASYRIRADQFKSLPLRGLEYLASIPCRYNSDRTHVFNRQLRGDPHYSATMALLFHAIRELTLELRARSNAHQKAPGPVWSIISAADPNGQPERPIRQVVAARELPAVAAGIEWIVLPSTPTTHYPLGLKLSQGLANTFHGFLDQIVRDASLPGSHRPTRHAALRLVGITHTGRQLDGETVVEASMLYNRFALNADATGTFHGHTARVVYERLLLPRLVDRPRELAYTESQLAARDGDGFPLYTDGSRARRIDNSSIGRLTFLKLLAHSSGISTAQQLDVLTRLDAQRLGFDEDELRAVFDRAIVVSFASASDVRLDWPGTPVLDVTAFNDVRSLAGTTTADYLLAAGEPLDALRRTLQRSRSGLVPEGSYRYDHAGIVWHTGVHGKTVARLTGVFLMDDAARQHDGHSIRRYLEGTPRWLRHWLSVVYHAPAEAGATSVLRELRSGPDAAGEAATATGRSADSLSFA